MNTSHDFSSIHVTRAQIRAPFDSKIIPPQKTRLSDTIDSVKVKIDNVKAKTDSVKAKTQGEQDPGPRSRSSVARRPVPAQLGASLTSSLLEGTPPRSLRLARQVSTSHDKSTPRELPPTPTEAWATARGATPGHERLPHDAWGTNSPRHASTPAGGQREQLVPTEALMRVCSAAHPSHRHHLQLCRTQGSPEALKHPLRRAQAYG
jgi:hypothetical protein